MDKVDYLAIGAGISGLSFANAIRTEVTARGGAEPSVLVIEADSEPGGYCKTIVQDGFVWDYSGHFFHFRHKDIEAWLRERMPGQEIRTVVKNSLIRFKGVDVDFPFQKNIHQLPKDDFVDCLYHLYFKDRPSTELRTGGAVEGGDSFYDMVHRKFGRGIAERFLIPYNEKLYACDLNQLDADAMGRFFPDADIDSIIENMKVADNASYNATFTYPRGGAIEYVRALLVDLPDEALSYNERLESIDVERKVARTSKREIEFGELVSSAPLPALASMCDVPHAADVFSWNKVLVFNLGFDRKGRTDAHWMYFPEREFCFYRVGFYDNIMGDDRMSLYVEIGADKDAEFDVEERKAQVLADLAAAGIVDGHELVSWHSVVLDPAYVHITGASNAELERLRGVYAERGVHTVGRYGGWTYCSIEDNIVETRALAAQLAERR